MRSVDSDRLFAPAGFPGSGFPRMPTVVADAAVATSHPLATRAGVRALESGGNAVDAALAAAACLTVCEPTENGLGGDAFALVWHGGELHGLNGSGRAPARMVERVVERFGPRSCTVPGVVRAWADLAQRFGRLGLDAPRPPAIDLAEGGVAATARISHRWRLVESQGRAPWPAPRVGERYTLPALAGTLRRIASDGPDGLYRGRVAQAIADATWLDAEDLAAHRSEWTTPIRIAHRGVEVCEMPPNGSGAAALIALGIFDGLERGEPLARLHGQIESMRLAFADAHRYVHDGPLPSRLLDSDHLAARRALIGEVAATDWLPSELPYSNTTYLCCVDSDRNAVSHIQSLFESFGSGVLAGDTGVVLQNRAACFLVRPLSSQRHRPGQASVPHDHPGHAARAGSAAGAVRDHGWAHAAAGPPPGRVPSCRRARPPGGARRRARPGRARTRGGAGGLGCGRMRTPSGPAATS